MQPGPTCPLSRSPCTFPCSCCASCGSLCPLRRSVRTPRRCLPGAFRVGRANIRRTAPARPAVPRRRLPSCPSPPRIQPIPSPHPDPPPTRPNTPRRTSRVFWKKLLLRARHPKTHPIRHPTPPAPSPSPTNRSPSSSVSSPPLPPSPSTSPFSPISPLFSLLAPLHSVRGFSGQCAKSPRRLSPPRTSSPRQNTPRATSRVFWKKLLLRARRPLSTPPTPPASPHPLQAPPPVTCPMPGGPASPSPSRLWADPPCRWPLPRRGRSGRPKLGISLKKIRPNRLSPARPLWGRAGERRFPPSPPRLCGPRPPRRPCTLSPRSTVTPESRS